MGFRSVYNRFLEESKQLDDLDGMRRAAARARRGYTIGLVVALAVASAASLALSFFAALVDMSGATTASILWAVMSRVGSMLISNAAFTMVLLRVRSERFTMLSARYLIRSLPTQICCMFILVFAQTLLSNLVSGALSFDPRAAAFGSVVVSSACMLLNACMLFFIFDGTSNPVEALSGALSLLVRHWAGSLGLSILFIAWSFAANIFYMDILYSQIIQTQSVNNVLLAVLLSHDAVLLQQVLVFYAVNYLVGAVFELMPLLGLAVCYEKEG